eukprot:2273169-Karenia_brevis.AAC.1
MSASFAARLESASFMAPSHGFRKDFTADQVVTLMSGCFAARLESASFMAALHGLLKDFSADQ